MPGSAADMLSRMGIKRGTAAAALVATLVLAGCSSAPSESGASTPSPTAAVPQVKSIKGALIGCHATTFSNIKVQDRGKTLELTGIGLRQGSGGYDDFLCILRELDAPQSLDAKIEQTRALDGRQSDAWTGYTIDWNYHPDDGLNAVIERTD